MGGRTATLFDPTEIYIVLFSHCFRAMNKKEVAQHTAIILIIVVSVGKVLEYSKSKYHTYHNSSLQMTIMVPDFMKTIRYLNRLMK